MSGTAAVGETPTVNETPPAAATPRFALRDRIALVGAALVGVGSLVLLASAPNNANGAPGPALVLLGGAVIAAAAALLRRGRPAILGGLAMGLLVVAALDAIPAIRYSADLDAFGGIIGGIARAVVVAGCLALAAALVGRPAGVRAVIGGGPGSMAFLVVLGTMLLTLGWLALVSVGVGFAARTLDGLALVAAIVAAWAVRVSGDAARGVTRFALQFGPLVLATGATLVTLDSVLVMAGHLGDLLESGAASAVAYALYLASAVPVLAGVVLALRGALTRRTGTSAGSPLDPAPESPPA